MTTSRIVKLNAGESLSFLVESASEVEGQYGPQVKFEGQTAEGENVTVFLSLDAAQRQLERIGATVESIAGSIIKLEKVAKNGKTFWNIYRSGSATRTAPKAPTPPPAEPDWLDGVEAEEAAFVAKVSGGANVDRWFAHYDKCFAHACELARRTKNPETVVTLEGISAIAATLYIATKSAI